MSLVSDTSLHTQNHNQNHSGYKVLPEAPSISIQRDHSQLSKMGKPCYESSMDEFKINHGEDYIDEQVIDIPSSPSYHSLNPNNHTRTHSTVSSNSSVAITHFPLLSHSISSPAITNGNADGGVGVGSLTNFSTENVIDLMEKEQEGIALKLMREIKLLQEENKVLKRKLNAAQSSSPWLSTSTSTSPRPSIGSSHSSLGNNNNTLVAKRRATTTDTGIRRVPGSLSHSRSRSGSFSNNNILSPTSSLGILVPPFGNLSVSGTGGGSSVMEDILLHGSDVSSDLQKRRSSAYSTSSNSSRRGHNLFGNYTIGGRERNSGSNGGWPLSFMGGHDDRGLLFGVHNPKCDADCSEDDYIGRQNQNHHQNHHHHHHHSRQHKDPINNY